MGMTYEQLSTFGILRQVYHQGPFNMFKSLVGHWKHSQCEEIAAKVKQFFYFYSINRFFY